jgi:DNA polymerase III epsilon subunit-like protein
MEAVAVDCEMVTTRDGEEVAQVCIIDAGGRKLLLSYVSPRSPVCDYKTRYSGVEPRHLVGAPSLASLRPHIAELLRGCLVVGHSVTQDLNLLGIEHPASSIRDTANLA